jgi:hypothetical protein
MKAFGGTGFAASLFNFRLVVASPTLHIGRDSLEDATSQSRKNHHFGY